MWARIITALGSDGWSTRLDGADLRTRGAAVLVNIETRESDEGLAAARWPAKLRPELEARPVSVALQGTGSSEGAPDYWLAVATHLAEAVDGWIYTETTGELCDAGGAHLATIRAARTDQPTRVMVSRAPDPTAWKAIAAALRADGWDTWFNGGLPAPNQRWVNLLANGQNVAIEVVTPSELRVVGSSPAYVEAATAHLARTLDGQIAAAEAAPAAPDDDDDDTDTDDEDHPIAIDWSKLPHAFTIVLRCDHTVSRAQLDDLARPHDRRHTISFERPRRGSDYVRVTFTGPDGIVELAQRLLTALHERHAAFPIDVET
ncbi:MAG: hypothetical protein KIT31_08930 [Deltaproteobacteria bacterium]|nr:hypothetical protein [Deltaproteobacteria bacterium]